MQSLGESGIYIDRGIAFSMDIEELIERGRQGDEVALMGIVKTSPSLTTSVDVNYCRRKILKEKNNFEE